MSKIVQETYEPLVQNAREQFSRSAGISFLLSPSTTSEQLELFLIAFVSQGVALTEPVEDWLVRASARCAEIGLPDLAKALRDHARAESGHHHMMIADTHALTKRWNAHFRPHLNADDLLRQPIGPGGIAYRRLHEDNIAGATPFAQIAIEYEIELLPVQYGEPMLQRCRTALGADVESGLSFLTEHMTIDIGHSRFNAAQLGRLLQQHPEYLECLARAGAAALVAYSHFLNDCRLWALQQSPHVQRIGN